MEQVEQVVTAPNNYRVVQKAHYYTSLVSEYRYRGEVLVTRGQCELLIDDHGWEYNANWTFDQRWEPVGDWQSSEGAAWANCLNHAADQGPYEVVKEAVL